MHTISPGPIGPADPSKVMCNNRQVWHMGQLAQIYPIRGHLRSDCAWAHECMPLHAHYMARASQISVAEENGKESL